MLVSYLDWQKLEHYLDNFILIIKAVLTTTSKLERNNNSYQLLTDFLDISCQDAKDCMNIIVSVFGIEIGTNLFVAQIPTNKLEKARDATVKTLSKQALTLYKAQSLTGFLSFCAKVVQLG